jgi:hypothetical protein
LQLHGYNFDGGNTEEKNRDVQKMGELEQPGGGANFDRYRRWKQRSVGNSEHGLQRRLVSGLVGKLVTEF